MTWTEGLLSELADVVSQGVDFSVAAIHQDRPIHSLGIGFAPEMADIERCADNRAQQTEAGCDFRQFRHVDSAGPPLKPEGRSEWGKLCRSGPAEMEAGTGIEPA